MVENTRSQLLWAARQEFADKGFYGASIADVAGHLGLTKQALLYYFKRKEDLYAEILREISARLMSLVADASRESGEIGSRIESTLLMLYQAALEHPEDTRILMRELLDNPRRADSARDWYLRPFLDQMVALLRGHTAFVDATDAAVFCAVYQLLGSAEYFAVSTATLGSMYGDDDYARIRDEYPRALQASVRRLLDAP